VQRAAGPRESRVSRRPALGCRAGQGWHFATLSREDLLDYLASAPTEDPTATASVIPLDSHRRLRGIGPADATWRAAAAPALTVARLGGRAKLSRAAVGQLARRQGS